MHLTLLGVCLNLLQEAIEGLGQLSNNFFKLYISQYEYFVGRSYKLKQTQNHYYDFIALGYI